MQQHQPGPKRIGQIGGVVERPVGRLKEIGQNEQGRNHEQERLESKATGKKPSGRQHRYAPHPPVRLIFIMR
ncbi:hypothetical protein GCM10011375_30730 [Hymenobacter qilianensis]|uniref:Uncharacterized protein n=1 Tax=Hymenobacter qilianensis TaxID=1385715 RepID=A0ACB5PUJ3_9BACT|nr:hypothetical protein GCM10011375_30730 [Hymenobacter qilianensis]